LVEITLLPPSVPLYVIDDLVGSTFLADHHKLVGSVLRALTSNDSDFVPLVEVSPPLGVLDTLDECIVHRYMHAD
jgi:hypothetical protein